MESELNVFHIKPELVDVGKGQFNVLVNGELIFSKVKEGRFPSDGEIRKRMLKKYK